MIIAVDGYSACGKSTLAKDLALALNITYIDSGAMYRAVTLYYLNNKAIHTDFQFEDLDLTKIHIEFIASKHPKILLNNEDVTDAIRQPIISDYVSELARLSNIRTAMVALQRQISKGQSVIMDGRDIGSVVFPNADVKLFVIADLEIRTQRRFLELTQKGIHQSLEQVRSNLLKRDHIDSTRLDSPLIQTPDAIVFDTSQLDRTQQLELALQLIRNKLGY